MPQTPGVNEAYPQPSGRLMALAAGAALAVTIIFLNILLTRHVSSPGSPGENLLFISLVLCFFPGLTVAGFVCSRPVRTGFYFNAAVSGLSSGMLPAVPFVILLALYIVYSIFIAPQDIGMLFILGGMTLFSPVIGGAGGALRGVYASYRFRKEFTGGPLVSAAEAGDVKAMMVLGSKFYSGDGIPADRARAAAWFSQAAELGLAAAQANLGEMYCNGDGVEQDYQKAREFWTKAAEQGDAEGQCGLGLLYAKGLSVETDKAKALEWWRKAAAQGHKRAMKNLEVLDAIGAGVEGTLMT